MKLTLKAAATAVLVAFFSAVYAEEGKSTAVYALQEAFNAVAAKAGPAVVNIKTVQESEPEFFFGIPQTYKYTMVGNGSGVIVDKDGYILTNMHVVNGAETIEVTRVAPSGKKITYPGKVVGAAPYLDIAVVKISDKDPLPFLKFSERCRVGDWGIAIGSPFGLEQTLTVGVISAVRQSLVIEGRRYNNMIQTDAAINQGNSGGPLLNVDGDIIGLNTAIFSPSHVFAGIGFAIPYSEIKPVLDDLKSGKQLKRGWAGLRLAELDRVMIRAWGLKDASGAVIEGVMLNSPAHKAGLRRGDVITAIDGSAVSSPEDVVSRLAIKRAGSEVKFTCLRGKKETDITVTLGEMPSEKSIQYVQDDRPSSQNRPDASWEGIKVSRTDEGMQVESVDQNSRLYGKILPGDIIRSVNNSRTADSGSFNKAVSGSSLQDGIVLDIVRDGTPMYLSITSR